VWKDLAAVAGDAEERTRCFTESLRCYAKGFDSAIARNDADGAAYCGINAAAVALWLDDGEKAAGYAGKAFEFAAKDSSYYGIATRAEAALILKREEEARLLYGEASAKSVSEKRWADLASTRKQCRALCLKIHGRRDQFDGCFTSGSVAILSGQESEDFPEDARGRIKAWLIENEVRHAFVGAVAAWDRELAGIAQELDIETHLVLPFGAAVPDGELGKKAVSITVLNSVTDAGSKGARNFTHRMIAARGVLLAGHLGVPLKALAVGDDPAATGAPVWLGSHIEPFSIHPTQPEQDGIPPKDVPPDPIPFPRTMGVGMDKEPVIALLHLHFPGYGKLDGKGYAVFQKAVLDTLSVRLASAEHPPISRHGHGGEYLFVFGNLYPAALMAMDFLKELEKTMAGTGLELPSMCLHAGLVRMDVNPLLNIYAPAGENVSRTGLIAAGLPPGAICATEIFTALSALELLRGFRFEHSGNILINGRADRLFRLHPTDRP